MKPVRLTAAQYRALPKKKRHKYGAKITTLDGIKFHSKGEAMRWNDLRQLELAGMIRKLRRQVPYALYATNRARRTYQILGYYLADFVYESYDGDAIVEDFKGYDDKHARWKRKHAEAEYGIKILLTGPAAKPRRKRGRAA